jgi:hypothetical protein
MTELELLIALEDCGVVALRKQGREVLCFSSDGVVPPKIPEELCKEIDLHRDWLLARIRRLPTRFL